MEPRKEIDPHATQIPTLGPAKITSPLALSVENGGVNLVTDEERILVDVAAGRITEAIRKGETPTRSPIRAQEQIDS